MHRMFYMVLLAVLLQACGSIPFLDNLIPPKNTLLPTSTPTMTLTATNTSTPTVTFTPTASQTIIHIPTFDPFQPTATFIPIPIILPGGTGTAISLISTSQANLGMGFLSVTVSTNKIFWGSCKRNKATITAVVEDPQEVLSVIIFTRVKSAKKEDYTPWTTGNAMHDHRDGTYTYVMIGSELEGHNHYKDSWVYFQLVATNDEGREVGRTPIYRESIALSPCM